MTNMEYVTSGSKLIRPHHKGSVRMSYMYGFWCAQFFFRKPACQKYFFQILSQKRRSDCESQESGFVFDPKNPPWVWILWIHDPFRVAFLLANLNPDFAIKNSLFCSIKDQTNLRLQSERSTSERGSFCRLVSQSGFRSLFLLMKLLFDRTNVLVHQ